MMQRYALNQKGKIIEAHLASKNDLYHCPECLEPVGLRQGFINRAHFYHLKEAAHCRAVKMSLKHFKIQQLLGSLFPEEAELEVRFDSIQRIADVALLKSRIIFEVQCSPISPLSLKKRSEDYLSIGFFPVWLMHTDRFGKKNAFHPELTLSGINVYYTDIDSQGKGQFFDQMALFDKGKSFVYGPFFPVDLTQFKWTKELGQPLLLPKSLLIGERLKRPLYMSNDLLSRYLQAQKEEKGEVNWLDRLHLFEERIAKKGEKESESIFGHFFWRYIWRYIQLFLTFYQNMIRALLERAANKKN